MKYRSEHVFRPGANELEYGNEKMMRLQEKKKSDR